MSDAGPTTDESETSESVPVPENVYVFSDDEDEGDDGEQGDNTGDALGGADVFEDVKVESDHCEAEEPTDVPQTMRQKRKLVEFDQNASNRLTDDGEQGDLGGLKREAKPSDSESSVDLADLELELSVEERKNLRMKKKLERQRAKQNLQSKERQRQEEFLKAKKNRFFDKSRIIPNEIYFGDIVVPLHVLHSYGQTERRPQTPVEGAKGIALQKYSNRSVPKPSTAQIRRGPGYINSRLAMMKRYLSAAGIRRKRYSALLKKCSDDTGRISAMTRLLREEGLEGEPTLSKCRLLRSSRGDSTDEADSLDESDDLDLDTSVIINPKGRTLRSGTTIVVQDPEDEQVKEEPSNDPDTMERTAEHHENIHPDLQRPPSESVPGKVDLNSSASQGDVKVET